MAIDINTASVDSEILILRATGDERESFFKKYPIIAYEDNFSMRVFRKPVNGTPIELQNDYDFLLDHEAGKIDYLIEFDEDDRIYVEEYEYETAYYKYLDSLRVTLGDTSFENLRYATNVLISYFHKAIFERITTLSDWSFTLDADVNRIEEIPTDIQLGFIVCYAALLVQKAELSSALRKAIVISDRSSRLDTTKHLKVMADAVESDEKELNKTFSDHLISTGVLDGSLVLAIKDSIKSRSLYIYEATAVLG